MSNSYAAHMMCKRIQVYYYYLHNATSVLDSLLGANCAQGLGVPFNTLIHLGELRTQLQPLLPIFLLLLASVNSVSPALRHLGMF